MRTPESKIRETILHSEEEVRLTALAYFARSHVMAIDDKVPKGKYLKVIKRVRKSPPQYPNEEERTDNERAG